MPNSNTSSNRPLCDAAAQARKIAALLRDPWMTPEADVYAMKS